MVLSRAGMTPPPVGTGGHGAARGAWVTGGGPPPWAGRWVVPPHTIAAQVCVPAPWEGVAASLLMLQSQGGASPPPPSKKNKKECVDHRSHVVFLLALPPTRPS